MLTEQEALLIAKKHVEDAMSALDFPQGSYAADEAFDTLDLALDTLNEGLAACGSENGPKSRSGAVGDAGDPGEGPEGEGEGLPSPRADLRLRWGRAWSHWGK